MDGLAAELQRADRPLLVLGGGGWTREAGANIIAFATNFDLPVVCAFRRQDKPWTAHRAIEIVDTFSNVQHFAELRPQQTGMAHMYPRVAEASTHSIRLKERRHALPGTFQVMPHCVMRLLGIA
ncbi:hypothetical protein AAFF27_15305 [Xylophilus sp. GW821-FHT01B05]